MYVACSKYIYIYIFGAQYIMIKNREKGTYYVFRTPRKSLIKNKSINIYIIEIYKIKNI